MRPVDRVTAALYHEEPDKVPFVDHFSQPEAVDLFFRGWRVSNEERWLLKQARWWGNDIISVSINAPTLLSEEIVKDPSKRGYVITRQAWGSITYTRRTPYFHIIIHSPIRWPEDLDRIEVPTLGKYEDKITAIARSVSKYKRQGYFVEAFHNGPFVMVWHWLRGLTTFLTDIVKDPYFAKRLVEFAMKNQIELSKAFIDEAEIDAIRLGNDMGTTRSLFFSPRAYKEIFNPWEKRLVYEYHKRGVFVFYHCHGNINLIFKDLVDTGIDAIDPLDPDDGINLAEIKEKYGDRITLRGGISKYIGRYNKREIYEHVKDRIRIAAPGGGFILQSAGGLPQDMPKENFYYYKKIINELRRYNMRI